MMISTMINVLDAFEKEHILTTLRADYEALREFLQRGNRNKTWRGIFTINGWDYDGRMRLLTRNRTKMIVWLTSRDNGSRHRMVCKDSDGNSIPIASSKGTFALCG